MSSFVYTRKEEVVNAITHGIGVILSVLAIVLLVKEAKIDTTPRQFLAITIYGVTMFMMYMSSTIMHLLPEGRAKDFFQMLDHSSIFLFIAGTYTPISLFVIKGDLGKMILIFVWTCAILGTVFKVVFLKKFTIITTIIYTVLGWFVVFLWEPIVSEMAYQGILFLIFGGLCYTIGTIFFLWRAIPYNHAIWHLFVVIGSAFHFITIFQYVIER
jgi:hemolysin III